MMNILPNSSFKVTNCSSKFPYSGQVCRKELSPLPRTYSSNTSLDVLEVTTQNQESLEQKLAILLNTILPSTNPSPECDVAFRSFSCLYALGACDNNSSVLATRATCSDLRDRVCVREWTRIIDFIGPGDLPVCEDLPSGNFMECTGTECRSSIVMMTLVRGGSRNSCMVGGGGGGCRGKGAP